MNSILLRFRDITIDSTIQAHNAVAARNKGRCLWGWWKKQQEPYPDPILEKLNKELTIIQENNGYGTIFFIDSGKKQFYKARLYKIHYVPNATSSLPPIAKLCPEYYRKSYCAAWFEIGLVEKIDSKELEEYVISTQTPTYSSDMRSSVDAARVGQPLDTTELSFLNDNISLWILEKGPEKDIRYITSFKSYEQKTYPTRGKYILHLSDLHFGEKHEFYIPKENEKSLGKDSLIEALSVDLEAQKIKLEDIALVLITGDLTWKASPHEFHEAERFIQELQSRFGISAVQIVCVPGNHDIEWRNADSKLNEDAELNYKNFSQNVYGEKPESFLGRFNEYYIGDRKIAVIAFNSCRLESPENAGMGYIGPEQFRKAKQFLSADNYDYSIAILHHHVLPVNFTEYYTSKDKAVSLLLDSEALQQFLIENKVNAVLHGHQHQPYYSQLHRIIPASFIGTREDVDGEVSIIGGGSVSVRHNELNNIGRNTYHLLEIVESEENPSRLQIKVDLRSRNGNGSGFYTVFTKTL